MSLQAADYSQFLRTVRRRTWNARGGQAVQIWVSRQERQLIESIAERERVKVGTVAVRMFRDGLKARTE